MNFLTDLINEFIEKKIISYLSKRKILKDLSKKIYEIDNPPVKEKQTFRTLNNWIIGVFSLLIFGILIFYFVTWYHPEDDGPDYALKYNLGDWHNWGDAFGGLSAPFIGLLSALLVYLSFQQQIKANRLVTDVRKEDNILNNLKDYLDRIETKFDVLETKISNYEFYEFRDNELGNSLNFRLSGFKPYMLKLYGQILTFLEIYSLKEQNKLPKGTQISDADHLELYGKDIFIKEITNLIKFCNFYSDYLYKWAKDVDLSTETKEVVYLYIREFLSFMDAKVIEEIVQLSTIEIYPYPQDRVKEKVGTLIWECEKFKDCQKELNLLSSERGNVHSILTQQSKRELKNTLEILFAKYKKADANLNEIEE